MFVLKSLTCVFVFFWFDLKFCVRFNKCLKSSGFNISSDDDVIDAPEMFDNQDPDVLVLD